MVLNGNWADFGVAWIIALIIAAAFVVLTKFLDR